MYFEPTNLTKESQRIQAEIDALDAEKAQSDAALLQYLTDLRLGLKNGTEQSPDSSRG